MSTRFSAGIFFIIMLRAFESARMNPFGRAVNREYTRGVAVSLRETERLQAMSREPRVHPLRRGVTASLRETEKLQAMSCEPRVNPLRRGVAA